MKRKTLESSVWGRYQAPNAQRPSEEWVKFFIRTLFENIGEDGKFGIPMYCFVNNTADFTAVPTAPLPKEELRIHDTLWLYGLTDGERRFILEKLPRRK